MKTRMYRKKYGYTRIDNGTLQNKNLSFKARGILTYMLSLPDDGDFSIEGIKKCNPADGETSIRSGLKELEDKRYLHRERIYQDNVISDGEYHIFEDCKDNKFPIKPTKDQVGGNQVQGSIGQCNSPNTSKDTLGEEELKNKEERRTGAYTHLPTLTYPLDVLKRLFKDWQVLDMLENCKIKKEQLDWLIYAVETKPDKIISMRGYVKKVLIKQFKYKVA